MANPGIAVLIVDGDQVPVTPFGDVLESAGGVDPTHKDIADWKFGVTLGIMVTVSVWFGEHWPAEGVKVYVPPVVLLIVAGDQVPVTPFGDVFDNVGAVAPEHKDNVGLKLGTTIGFITTFSTWVVAHCPAFGVKV